MSSWVVSSGSTRAPRWKALVSGPLTGGGEMLPERDTVAHRPGNRAGTCATPTRTSPEGADGDGARMDASSDRSRATRVPPAWVPWLHTATWAVRGCPGPTLAGPFTEVMTKS